MTVALHGTAAVAGRAAGPAHVADVDGDVSEVPAGAILVVRVFHPYFAPVLLRVGGLVVEEGGLLQHAVILAREFRVPAVVGAVGARAAIRSGDRVTLDGATGLVTVAPEMTPPDSGSRPG